MIGRGKGKYISETRSSECASGLPEHQAMEGLIFLKRRFHGNRLEGAVIGVS